MSDKIQIKGVVFDLDGSLVDSMWMWRAIDVEFLGRYHNAVPERLTDAIEGMSFTETATYFKETFDLPLSVEEIKETWIQMAYDKYSNEVDFKPGVKAFLDYLREQQIPVSIATSNSRSLVNAVLNSLQIDTYFHTVVTACDVNKGKPAPDIYLFAANAMQVDPKDCLVFEDVPNGIMAGKNAGMRVIAVQDDFSDHQDAQKRLLADGYITDYAQILAYMEEKGICNWSSFLSKEKEV